LTDLKRKKQKNRGNIILLSKESKNKKNSKNKIINAVIVIQGTVKRYIGKRQGSHSVLGIVKQGNKQNKNQKWIKVSIS
jgi:hypothetical protein